MIGFIIALAIIGLIAGAIARLLVPGRDPIGFLGTIVLGMLGSFVGGFIETAVQYHTVSIHQFHPTGLIGSIIGAIVLLVLWRLSGHERGRGRYRYRR
ncbi:MAG TPA: GlsB/YeaQ/YmgE family stress response membrane protein [Streptosporangiaceae bacterium]|nr:GlsB/YeaQ/YmgE family stress response membrane protein [Streptosporangiaceae bacterium]